MTSIEQAEAFLSLLAQEPLFNLNGQRVFEVVDENNHWNKVFVSFPASANDNAEAGTFDMARRIVWPEGMFR